MCAIEVGDLHLLGEAAVGVATATEFAMADAEIEALLSTALDALPADAPARIELLAGLARTLPGHTERPSIGCARPSSSPTPRRAAAAHHRPRHRHPRHLGSWPSPVPPRRDRRGDRPGATTSTWSSSPSRHAPGAPPRSTSSASTGEANDERAIVRQWAEQSRRPFFLALASMMTIAEHLRHGRPARR